MTTVPINVEDRLELFIDRVMAHSLEGDATLRMHRPVPREIVLRTDRPWEGNACGYINVFRDNGKIRMYYKTCNFEIIAADNQGEEADGLRWTHPYYVAYAESLDGIHFERPNMGMIKYQDFSGVPVRDPLANNIILESNPEISFRPAGFSVFRDTNPDAPENERYKALASNATANPETSLLFALTSPDGIHWTVNPEPIVKRLRFDSQNLAFWDSVHGCYRAYMRSWRDVWRRYISTSTSHDFVNWTEPELIELPDAVPHELYTNQVQPYPRAPHIFLGFPTRYVEREFDRGLDLLPDVDERQRRAGIKPRFGSAVTEGLLMAGRDGKTFHMWNEAFLRPGPQITGSWAYGNQYQGLGIIETPSALEEAPRELSFYVVERYFLNKKNAFFRRYSMRMDGFVSVNAPLSGGTVVTPPLTFKGNNLFLNIETSAAGSARVQLEDADGAPVPGYTLDDCHEIYGDRIAYPVAWREKNGCAELAGKPVRMRIVLRDADLYAFHFTDEQESVCWV